MSLICNIYSLVDEHLSYFYFLDIVNRSEKKIPLPWDIDSFLYVSWSGIVDHVADLAPNFDKHLSFHHNFITVHSN